MKTTYPPKTAKPKAPVHRAALAALALPVAGLLLAATGCSHVTIESDPPGAAIYWSPNGVDDWRPWPPRAWSGEPVPAPLTPIRQSGSYSDTVWVTVEMDGYYRPLPQSVQIYPLRREKARFELEPTPEYAAARRRAEGFVRYRGEWVRPEDANLVEFQGAWMTEDEAFRLRQIAAGLVEYEGEWVTPEVRDTRFAEAQRARGLQLFKDRWMTPEAMAAETRIDEEVARIATSGPASLEAPKVVGRIDDPVSRVRLLNLTSGPVRFLVSGPTSREALLGPYEPQMADGLVLEPGMYRVAAVPVARDASAATTAAQISDDVRASLAADLELPIMYLEQPLAPGFQYQYTFDGGMNLELGEMREYQTPDIQLPDDLPTIVEPDIQVPEQERPQRGGPPAGAGGGGRGGG